MMIKTRKKRIIKNKTLKITLSKKKAFLNDLFREWKKQTNGDIRLDKETTYKDDYYLSIGKNHDRKNHIHLLLHNFKQNHNLYNNIIYIFKKYDIKKSKIIYSKNEFKLNIYSDPKKLIKNMIENFTKFMNF